MAYVALSPEQLKRSAVPVEPTLVTTPDGSDELAQPRALEAIEFGMSVPGPGYNVYALGEVQTGMHATVGRRLQDLAAQGDVPHDLCYVANFTKPGEPLAMLLPAGVGHRVRDDINHLLSSLTTMIPAAFNSDEFRQQIDELQSEMRHRQAADTKELQDQAQQHGLVMLPTPGGFIFAPQRDGKVLEASDYDALDKTEQQTVSDAIDVMNEKLRERLQAYPGFQEELIRQQRALAESTARQVLTSLTGKLRARYHQHENVIVHLNAIGSHLLENVEKLLLLTASKSPDPRTSAEELLREYQINLLVDHSESQCAPVVYESNPSLENLVGKLEHRLEYGVPVSDFTLIRPGALHRANGGYLVLDAERLVNKPFAWEALKRALLDGRVRIESVNQLLSMAYSISLDPAPVPLNVKVVLLGSRYLYHLLRRYDHDFDSLFKVLADFSDEVQWNTDNEVAYGKLLREFEEREKLRPIDDSALARLLEYGSRLVDDRRHLSAHTEELFDVVREADHFSAKEEASTISQAHVQQAIDKRAYRVDRIRELVLQNIERGVTVVETNGSKVGQINGLSVVSIGKLFFGQPSRITATARLGRGEFIDIERESKLGGNIHSKAVMIVSNFIGYRYAKEQPLSLHASLVFEQSYGGVEGDSASVAEVCALISAIIDQPLRQELAVTGSMDQHGAVQAIGGVNEKIEGFFEVCSTDGLSGTQGVVIPHSNQDNLMLRDEVVEAVAQGLFHIYTVAHVDDAMALLFGTFNEPADIKDIDAQVQERIKTLHGLWKQAQGESIEKS